MRGPVFALSLWAILYHRIRVEVPWTRICLYGDCLNGDLGHGFCLNGDFGGFLGFGGWETAVVSGQWSVVSGRWAVGSGWRDGEAPRAGVRWIAGEGAHKGRNCRGVAGEGRGVGGEQGHPFGQQWFAVSGGAESQGRGEGARETEGEERVKASNPLNPGTRFSWQPQMWTAPLGQFGAYASYWERTFRR